MGRTLLTADEFNVARANELLSATLSQPVTAVHTQPLGEGVGLMSSIARATLTLADNSTETVVFKYVAETDNAAISKGLNFYANEVNFYRHLSRDCPMPTPQCLYAHVDDDSQDFLLILEDHGDAAVGDQLKGCDRTVMTTAFRRAAELHGQYWGNADDFAWLNPQNVAATNKFRRDAIYLPGVEPTLERFPHLFTDNLDATVREIGERFAELFDAAMSGPQTVIHGDYRIDNMLLPTIDGKTDIIAVDWQNSGKGNGAHDIAYFSSQSCGPELRGKTELSELKNYHATLQNAGVKDYSFDECLHYYRLNLLITMITPIAVCGTLDSGNDRGLELGKVMLERSLAALKTMECEALLRAL